MFFFLQQTNKKKNSLFNKKKHPKWKYWYNKKKSNKHKKKEDLQPGQDEKCEHIHFHRGREGQYIFKGRHKAPKGLIFQLFYILCEWVYCIYVCVLLRNVLEKMCQTEWNFYNCVCVCACFVLILGILRFFIPAKYIRDAAEQYLIDHFGELKYPLGMHHRSMKEGIFFLFL